MRNGRVHSEQRELFVPPVKKLLNVALTVSKEKFAPREKGTLTVRLTDADGRPVAGGAVGVTVFDEAVTYIQEEFAPSPKVFYHGQRRESSPFVEMSSDKIFPLAGAVQRPESSWSSPMWWDGVMIGVGRDMVLGGARSDRRLIAGRAFGMAVLDEADTKMQAAAAPAPGKADGYSEMNMRNESLPESDAGELSPSAETFIRNNFSDTALWLPDLRTDADGVATAEITFPDSLTTWRARAYGIMADTKVGDAKATALTAKNLIVRLQTPRFLVERDEVVISANVHNYLAKAKMVEVKLEAPLELLRPLRFDYQGFERHLRKKIRVPAGGEARVDFPLKVKQSGTAALTVRALTDEESDAMQLTLPLLVHGVNKTVAQSGAFAVDADGERSLTLELPADIDPEQTRLEVTLSPSLGGVMIDALPYLIAYPHGCVEQTMSRFYPAVLVRDTLKKAGADLEKIGAQRRQLSAERLQGLQKQRAADGGNPVYDSAELDRVVKAGLQRLYNFQRGDGGWGWWGGDESSPFQTAYVVMGLQTAADAGVSVSGAVLQNGKNFLQSAVRRELKKEQDRQNLGGLETQAYVAYVLALVKQDADADHKKWLDELHERRGELNNYGKSLLALTFKLRGDEARARLLLQNILQFAERDDTNGTAWIRTPQQGWWFWWNSDIETNAWVLRALTVIEPGHELAPRLVKWLLNNRRGGHYWRSTRDTALVISAMTEYMRVSGESAPDYALTVSLDGRPVREARVTRENFFTFDNRLVLHGLQVPAGAHTLTVAKRGAGALYYSAALSYFTKEEDVKGAGNEIEIRREYFRLKPRTETVTVSGGRSWLEKLFGNKTVTCEGLDWRNYSRQLTPSETKPLRDGFDRVPLANGDAVVSGEQIEVVLRIKARNTYDYLAIEDLKPAGCEPVELRSGGRYAGGLCANVELRDEKTVFYLPLLEQGEHLLRYKLRAETPGQFHALPAQGAAMCAPEVRAISDEQRVEIKDR